MDELFTGVRARGMLFWPCAEALLPHAPAAGRLREVRRPTYTAQGLAPELSMTAPNVRRPRPRVNLNAGHSSAQTSAEAGTRRREGVQEPPGTPPSPPAQNHTPHANDAEDARRAAITARTCSSKAYEARGGAGVG